MVGVLVPGVAWYRDRRGEDLLLPVDTVVSPVRVAESAAAGRFAVWTLPEGAVAIDRRYLPLEPVEIDKVFPLGAADIPWSAGGTDLSRGWQALFREREALAPWGDGLDAQLLRLYLRHTPPRSTFRAGPGKRDLRYLYPQLVPAPLAYRPSGGYARLPEALRTACRPIVAEGGYVRLAAGQQQLRLRADDLDAAMADLEGAKEPEFWRLLPPEAQSPLLIVPR